MKTEVNNIESTINTKGAMSVEINNMVNTIESRLKTLGKYYVALDYARYIIVSGMTGTYEESLITAEHTKSDPYIALNAITQVITAAQKEIDRVCAIGREEDLGEVLNENSYDSFLPACSEFEIMSDDCRDNVEFVMENLKSFLFNMYEDEERMVDMIDDNSLSDAEVNLYKRSEEERIEFIEKLEASLETVE